MLRIEMVLARNAGLPFDPQLYEMEKITEGEWFSIWQMEVAPAFLSEVEEDLKQGVTEGDVVAFQVLSKRV